MTSSGIHRARPGAADMAPSTADPAIQIAPDIWMGPALTNSYLICAPEGRIIIGTGISFEGPLLRAKYDAVDDRPIKAVILTQGHYDHVGGINHFLEPDGSTQVIVGQEWATWKLDNERLLQFRANRSAFAFADRLTEGIAAVRAALPDADITQGQPRPTLEVAEAHPLRVAGLDLELLPFTGGETRDSLVVWWPERRTAFTGNLFGPLFGHVPNLVTIRGDRYRDALDYVETVQGVRDLDAEVVVTGHFDPIEGAELIAHTLDSMIEAMTSVHDQVIAGMNAGTDVHTLMAQVRVPEHLDVGEGYGQTKWNVRAIWENCTGWFKADSTTELFASARTEVDADLVALAGGPGPVAAAADARLEADEPVHALHLAEVALRVDPRHLEALRVSIAAHHLLAARTTNFWESAWIADQLKHLNQRLADAQGPAR